MNIVADIAQTIVGTEMDDLVFKLILAIIGLISSLGAGGYLITAAVSRVIDKQGGYIQAQSDALAGSVQSMQIVNAGLQTQLNQQQTQINDLRIERDGEKLRFKETSQKLHEEIAFFKTEFDRTIGEKNQLEKSLQAAQSERESVIFQMGKVTAENLQLTVANTRLEADKALLTALVEQYTHKITELEGRVRQLEAKTEKLENAPLEAPTAPIPVSPPPSDPVPPSPETESGEPKPVDPAAPAPEEGVAITLEKHEGENNV